MRSEKVKDSFRPHLQNHPNWTMKNLFDEHSSMVTFKINVFVQDLYDLCHIQ